MQAITIEYPNYITKYVEERWLASTIAGQILVGTLGGYRSGVGSHRLSDRGEGHYADLLVGDVENLSLNIPGLHLRGVTSRGARAVVQIIDDIDGHVFCSTAGKYDERRHDQIRDKNPALTNYVVFRTLPFLQTFFRMFRTFYGTDQFCRAGGMVEYRDDGRSREHTADNFERAMCARAGRITREDLYRAVFVKPSAYAHEYEFRLGALPFDKRAVTPLFVKDLPGEFADKFATAVDSSG